MFQLLAQSEPTPEWLMNPVYPFIIALIVIGWAWVIEKLDKDAAYFYLPRHWLNLGQLGIGLVAVALMMLIPLFIIGLFLGVLLMAGGIVGYAYYRNAQVPESDRWSFSLESLQQQFSQRQQERAQRQASMTLLTKNEKAVQVPSGDDPEVAAHELMEDVVDFAVERDAEAFEVAVDNERAGVFVRVDGVRYQQPIEVSPQLGLELIDYLKGAAGLDVSDRRKRQSGKLFVIGTQYGRHEMEMETSGSTRGLTLTTELDPSRRWNLKFDQLGLLDAQRQQVETALDAEPRRACIIAGPHRQGISTTLYCLMQRHDPYTASVVTLEDETLTGCEGVHHTAVGENITPEQFNRQLGGLLRGDPHVVMLSHLADEQTARLIAQNATELRAYFPLHEDDTFSALQSWINLVGDRKQAANSLGLIMAQRLVRKLCGTCRIAYRPDASALRKLNLPTDKITRLYRSSGKVQGKEEEAPETCPDCHGLAYQGRVGIFEVMPIDDEARKHIINEDAQQLRAHLRKQKMLWLQEAALHKVVQGVTDIKEITRVLGASAGGEQQQPQQGQGQGQGQSQGSAQPSTGGSGAQQQAGQS